MRFTILCGESKKTHRIKEKTVKWDMHRKIGRTFCGQTTTDTIDYWVDNAGGIPFCAVCYRAYMKSVGKRIPRTTKLGRQMTTVERWVEE